MLMWILGIVALWLIADAGHALVVSARHQAWERKLRRGPDGVREGCEAFTVGEGTTAFLLVHGFADSPFLWHKLAPRLAESGFTCRAMRLPGFAMPIEAYARTTRQQWKQAVAEEAAKLRREHERVILVGHSLGGTIVTAVIQEQPGLADGVVQICPLLSVSSRRSLGIPVRRLYLAADALTVFSSVTESFFPIDLHDPNEAASYPRSLFTPLSIYREMFALLHEVCTGPRTWNRPLLLVMSEDDRVVDPRAAETFLYSWPALQLSAHTVTGAGHVIPLDYGWEKVSRHIAAFSVLNTEP